MHSRKFTTFLSFVLLVASVLGGASSSRAQAPTASQRSTQPPSGRRLTITDAAGRVHKRPLAIRSTDAQRKAVIARYKALHAKAAQNAKSEVKK
jgi:hypothetical protein